MNKENKNINKIKQSVANELKTLSLTKKDRTFLLSLIELFDWLSEKEDERFLAKLQKLILDRNPELDKELKVRLASIESQINANKNIKVMHFIAFSMYYKIEKVEIYIKKLPASWDNLIQEINKIDFVEMLVMVNKVSTKKETIYSKKFFKEKEWTEELIRVLDTNVCINVRITLFYKKTDL